MTSFSGSPGGPVRRRSLDHLSVLRSLTERDRFLVDLLGEHQVLTTGQVTQLAFPRPGPPTVATATAELASTTRACLADGLWLIPGAGRRLRLVDLPSGTERPRPADDGLLWDEE